MLFSKIFKALRPSNIVRVVKSAGQTIFSTITKKRLQIPDDDAGYLRAYKSCVWVRRCIDLRGSCVARSPIKLFQAGAGGDVKELTDHQILNVLQNVKDPSMTRSDLWRQTEIDTQIYGRALWYLEYFNTSEPQAIFRLPPPYVMPVPDSRPGFYVKHFVYKPNVEGVEEIWYPPERICFFRVPDPDNPFAGLSPTSSIMFEINILMEANHWNAEFFRNGARPDGFLSLKEDADAEKRKMIETALRIQYGGDDNRRGIGVLPSGAEWVRTALTPQETDFRQSGKDARDSICAGYGVPVFMVSGNEAAYFATAGTQKESFWEETIDPQLGWYDEHLNEQFVPRFQRAEKLFLAHDINDVPAMVEKRQRRQEQLQKATGMPVMTINEARKELNLLPVPGGDTILVPANTLPLSDATGEEPGEGEHEHDLPEIELPDEAEEEVEEEAEEEVEEELSEQDRDGE